MNRKHIVRNVVAGLFAVAAASGAMAHEAGYDAGATTSQLSRAEVIADLMLWKRAGLDTYERNEYVDTTSPAYQRALAEYRSLRSGPEYLAEVRRIASERHETVAATTDRSAPKAQ